MNRYRLYLTSGALRDLQRLKQIPAVYVRIRDAIKELEEDPRPVPSKQLRDRHGQRTRRMGDYRIVYLVDDQERSVTVVAVAHTKDVYR